MIKDMSVDKKILEELERFKKINKYITEQDVPPPPAGEVPPPPGPEGAVPPPPAGGAGPEAGAPPAPVDVENDPDVEKIDAPEEGGDTEAGGEGGEGGTEELDITDLVNSQKEVVSKQDDYFKQLFSQIEKLEAKLGEMDNLVNKINSLEATIERSRPKTPQEKLELRSLDSGPYNQKLTDFFTDKEQDMQKSGKNEYILTTDEVENFTPSDIRNSFELDSDKNNFGI